MVISAFTSDELTDRPVSDSELTCARSSSATRSLTGDDDCATFGFSRVGSHWHGASETSAVTPEATYLGNGQTGCCSLNFIAHTAVDAAVSPLRLYRLQPLDMVSPGKGGDCDSGLITPVKRTWGLGAGATFRRPW